MKLTIDQINLALNHKTIGPGILEYDDFSNVKTDSIESLSDDDLKRFEKAFSQAANDGWFDHILSYENPPLMETEPKPPLSICGIEGLYIVCYTAWEANECSFFVTKAEAESFADGEYKVFLDVYSSITGDDSE